MAFSRCGPNKGLANGTGMPNQPIPVRQHESGDVILSVDSLSNSEREAGHGLEKTQVFASRFSQRPAADVKAGTASLPLNY